MTAQSESESERESQLRHGCVCYLQIPATDTFGSAAFYEKIFGWRIERPYASFEAPGLIGQWIEGGPAPDAAGILIWINVDHIDETLELVRAAGGAVIEPPSVDGPRWLAKIRDPGQNVIGVVQHGARS